MIYLSLRFKKTLNPLTIFLILRNNVNKYNKDFIIIQFPPLHVDKG